MRYQVEYVTQVNADQPDDLFLCAASFEDRCTAAVERFSESYKARLSCIFRYMPSEVDQVGFDDKRDHNAARLADLLMQRTSEFLPVTIICDKHVVDDGAAQLSRIIEAHFPSGCQSVTIDMSSFTKVYLWELLWVLIDRHQVQAIQVLYTQSRSIPTDSLTSGGFSPVIVQKFSGKFSPARRTLLLGFVGFEPQRAILIYEEFEPERAEFFVSYNPDREEYFHRAVKSNNYLLTRPGVRWSRVHPYDLESISKALETSIGFGRGLGEAKNIVLVTLGTKVQNLAGFLLWYRHREVRLAYAFPSQYAKDHLRLRPGSTFSFRFGREDFKAEKSDRIDAPSVLE